METSVKQIKSAIGLAGLLTGALLVLPACVAEQGDEDAGDVSVAESEAHGSKTKTKPPAFTIMVSNTSGDPAIKSWWNAPYIRDLYAAGRSEVPNVGWTDGDRAGYKCAYMFLERGSELVGRVTFTRVAGYGKINDKYMNEFERAYDGGFDYTDQSECPGPSQEYEAWDGPDFRPQIFFTDNSGKQLEDRSYTNTTGDAIKAGVLKFREFERITTPFTDTGGLDTCDDYCTVYERVTVLAYVKQDGEFFPAMAIYYDSLAPDVTLEESAP
jgi:hypothetical protein